MREEIDWDSVYAQLPDLMGLPRLKLRGRLWYGPYRLDGSPHDRWDKMVIKQGTRDRMPLVMEQGGNGMTLWSWMVQYGRMSNEQVRAVLLGREKKELVFSDDEYIGPVKYVEPWMFIEQGGADKKWFCPLFCFLTSFYGLDKVRDAFGRYNVSTGLKERNSGVIGTRFWYKDRQGRICFDKTMFYAPDGHRIKDCPPMRKYKRKWGYRADCLFGEDSLVEGRPVFVVESEKSAIIAYLEYPEYNWVACGGKNGLRALKNLDGYDVWLVPDVDAAEEWGKMGKVWKWWQKCGQVGEKWDIADYILSKKAQ